MSLEKICVLADQCKIAGSAACNVTCFPYVLTHGSDGRGGLWNASGVPSKYKAADVEIIRDQNPAAYRIIRTFIDNAIDFVDQGMGLFLYSVPNADNPKGTGTGKSTAAAAIVNAYTKARIIAHAKGEKRIGGSQPAFYIRMSEVQNVYNSQFRGNHDMQDAAAKKYYQMKKTMLETDLLVLDDIGLRDAKTLVNEIYEVIDYRNNEEGRATILTSNLPVQKIGDLLSDQIESRVQEMCELIPFKGKDNRKKFV